MIQVEMDKLKFLETKDFKASQPTIKDDILNMNLRLTNLRSKA